MAGRIVVFGATGYTGKLVSQALVERGARPVLAARSQDKLDQLASELNTPEPLDTQTADVGDPRSVRALVERGDVLVSTVGPFARWGNAAADADDFASKLPKPLWISPDDVAEQALKGLEKGHRVVTPGIGNRVSGAFSRATPNAVLLRVLRSAS